MFNKFRKRAITLMTFLVGCLGIVGFCVAEKTIPAQAETTIESTQLVSTDATVESASGVKISSDSAYEGKLEGIFTGDTTIKFNFAEPHEGWYAGNFVFRVTDAVDTTKYFDIEYKVVHTWASSTYTKIGHTNAYVKYGSEVRTSKQSGAAWYNKEVLNAAADTNGVICAPSMTINAAYPQVGILKLGYDANGHFSVRVNKQKTSDLRAIAVFDGTKTFEDQVSWGLPEMPFENGYIISFSSEFEHASTTDRATDVCFKSIQNGNEVFDLTATSIETPLFYSEYISRNHITIAEHEDFNGYGLGAEIVIPEATYTSATVTEPTAVENIEIQLPSGKKETVVAGQKYTITEAGLHVVVYTVGENSASFGFTTIKNKSYYAKDLFTAQSAAEISQDGGVRISSDEEYRGAFKGVFAGDTMIKFNFPEEYDGWYGGNFVIRVSDALDSTKYFDVEYRVLSTWDSASAGGTIGYTGVYVNYNENVRSARYYGDTWYNDYKTNAETANYAPAFRNFRAQDGILQLVYENGKLAVQVNKNNSTDVKTIAVFDGTETFEDQKSWGLPEMPFENGYTISFSSSFANAKTEDKGTDVCFKQVITGGTTYDLTSTRFLSTEYSFDLQIANTAKIDGEFYIPCNEEIGEARGRYEISFNGGAWKIIQNVAVDVTADISKVGEKTITVVDNTLADEWEVLQKNYVLHVEEAYELAFDVDGGEPIASIYFSENTTERIVVKDAKKLFWAFDGWYIGADAWSGDMSELYGKSVTLTAHWKDVEAPTVSLSEEIDGVMIAVVGSQTTISVSDVKASDLAQPNEVTVLIELKRPNEEWIELGNSTKIDLTEEGVYLVRYTARDNAGLTSFVERSIQVIGRNSPVLTAVEGYVQSAVIGESVTIAMVSAVDADGESLPVIATVVRGGETIDPLDGVFMPTLEGVYTVTYTATDSMGLKGIFYYEITVVNDTLAPIISVDFEDCEAALGSTVSIPTATATDNVTENLSVNVKVTFGTEEIVVENNEFVVEKEGVYTIVYSTVDGAGNITEKRVQITVNDSTGAGANGIGGAITDTFDNLFEPIEEFFNDLSEQIEAFFSGTGNSSSGCGSSLGGMTVFAPVAIYGIGLFIAKKKKK